MSIDNVFHDGQPQTRSSHLARPLVVDPVEPVENLRELLFRYSDSFVLNHHDEFSLSRRNRQQNFLSLR